MIRKQVDSSALSRVGYDRLTRTLEVEFKPKPGNSVGDIWQYWEVDATIADLMQRGEGSVGTMFGVVRRDSSMTSRKLDFDEITCPDCGIQSPSYAAGQGCVDCARAKAETTKA
jgi:hypothetical protein